MKTIHTRTIRVFYITRGERLVGIDIDRETLFRNLKIRPDSEGVTVHERDEIVGVITGELVDWNSVEPGPPRPKVHWFCPQCGQQHFDDGFSDNANHFLSESFCDCVKWWLVHCTPPTDRQSDTSRESGRTKR